VAKEAIRKTPFVGLLTEVFKGFYLDRAGTKEERDAIQTKIT
jgi:hypothetical protein